MTGAVGEHFRLWLRAGLSGCEFARQFAIKPKRIGMELYLDDLPSAVEVNRAFDQYALAGRAAIAVLPTITSEFALVELLNALTLNPRWSVRVLSKASPAGGALVSLEWTTQQGALSEVMGFAPLLTMPVSRRSPYVAIATWPGERANPYRGAGVTPPGREGVVSFLDAPHGLRQQMYDERWDRTVARVTALMTVPRDNARLYRRTAFVLSKDMVVRLQSASTVE